MPTLSLIKPLSFLQPAPERTRSQKMVLAAVLGLMMAACGKGGNGAEPGAGAAPPPAEVGVVTVSQGDVGLVTELPGRLEASRVAQVRARAAGIGEQVHLLRASIRAKKLHAQPGTRRCSLV